MKKRLFVLVLALLLASFAVEAIQYYDSGYGGGSASMSELLNLSNINVLDFYNQYGSYVDMVLFLLIFLGVAKGVFKDHFKEGNKAIYVGVGIFLSLALLLYEEQANFRLLTAFGPIVMFIFIAIIVYLIFHALYKSGGGGVFAVAVGYLILYFFVMNWFDDYLYNASGFWNIVASIANWGALIAAIIAVWGLILGIINMWKKTFP